jgi:hypothetical protein
MLEARQAIMRAIGADAFDEPRIRAAAATVSVFEAGGALSMAKLFPKIRTVLTPDQQPAPVEDLTFLTEDLLCLDDGERSAAHADRVVTTTTRRKS